MSYELKHRRGATAQHSTFVGAPGEITVDTDKNVAVVHDGVTAGGFPQVNSAALAASGGAGMIGYMPAGTGAVATTVQEKLREKTVSVFDFMTESQINAVKAGTSTDDSTAIQAFYTHLATNGGVGELVNGLTFTVNSRIYISGGSKPFLVFGYGATIKRGSDFAASVIEINATNGVEHHGLTVDCQHQTYPNGNHGLVYSNCNNSIAVDVNVLNHKNSAILMYATTPGLYKNNLMRNCRALGNAFAPANNGLLIAGIDYSHIENGYAENCTGSPGYGLQLKNQCNWSSLSGRAKNCVAAGAFGNDISDFGVTDSYVNIELSDGCKNAFAASYAVRNTVRLGTVLSPNVSSLNSVDLQYCSYNNINLGMVKADGASHVAFRFRAGCSDNIARVDVLYRTLGSASGCAATFDSGVTGNQVHVGKISNATVSETSSIATDNSANITNICEYEPAAQYTKRTIAADAIIVGANRFINVTVDTEAAAATDNLSTITGAEVEGQTVRIRTASNVRDVTVKHNTGNILLNGAVDFVLGSTSSTLTLVWNSTVSAWCEAGRGNNI